ncbi:MAG: hypothetical protein ACI83Y_001227 [Candidatus Azotimanducaceae bacterium]|jgi:hypothetical protein
MIGDRTEAERHVAPAPNPVQEPDPARLPQPRSAQPEIQMGKAIAQAKLSVGPAGDKHEHEADAVAGRVVRSIRSAPTDTNARAYGPPSSRVQRRPGDSTSPDIGLIESGAGDDGENIGGRVGRIQRSNTPPTQAQNPPNVRRIQRSACREHGSADLVVQRDLSEMASNVGGALFSGAKAIGKGLASGASAIRNAAAGVAKAIHRSDFNDLNATQFLVSAGGQIEAINRRDEDGTVVYYKTGSVVQGDGERPTITPYEHARAMPDGWLPTVTHINGMMVKPNEGLGSALRLQRELESAGGEALLAADVPSVLYTYSAHRGFVTDLAECVWGKLYQDDDATDRQTQIMLDAVANKHRTTVSAHSRGTIKTDNAVRTAHAQISGQHLTVALADPTVHQRALDAAEIAAASLDMGLNAGMLAPVYERLVARQVADEMATADMDQYVQLIYAGNAVQFPSASVNLKLVVAVYDPVALGVGKYFNFAAGSKTELTEVEGGHGFDDNYAATVAAMIISDLQARP